MRTRRNNYVSKKTAQSILRTLFSPSDIRAIDYLRAVVLCGLPGSGKSTIGQLLVTCYGFERFSSDQIRTKELFKDQAHRLGKQHDMVMMSRYVVYEELALRVGKALSNGKKVVIDGTHMDEKRLTVLGGVLAQIPVEQVAFIVLKPPEWIMRRRLVKESNEGAKEWWSIYKYWRKYMKEGKASFPTEKTFPRIRQMQVRRYAIRTFDWVPEIKAIFWDVDGTLYKDVPVLHDLIDRMFVKEFSRAKKLGVKKGVTQFFATYKKLGSKTKTLESAGINGREAVRKFTEQTDYDKYLRKDIKLRRTFKNLNHLRHFVFSNAGLEETKKKLKALGLAESIFEKIIATHDSPYLKPDVRAYKWAIRESRFKAENILMVGDREKADIIPAKKAGMRTCYVWGVSRKADVSAPSVYEVAELFGKEF